MSSSEKTGSSRAAWAVPALMVVLLVLADVTFDAYFWRIPKRTPFWVDHGYEFLWTLRSLERPKPPGSVRVVALGSSVLGSLDPHQVKGLVEARDPTLRLEVSRLLLPGIKPSDSRLLLDGESQAMRMDVAVLVLNLADFLNPSFEADLKEQVRYVLPPWRTLLERHAHIPGMSGKLDLLFAGASHFYRYRRYLRSCVQDHVKIALQRLRRQRPSGAYGVLADGYAERHFGVAASSIADGKLEYYIEPEWLHQQGRLRLSFSVGGQPIAEREETTAGWKAITLEGARIRGATLEVAADSAWTPRAAGDSHDVRLLGPRLRISGDGRRARRHAAGEHGRDGGQQVRELLRMNGAVGQEFADRWAAALASNTPFGHRMRAYERVKLSVREMSFDPSGEYAELERTVAGLAKRGTRVVLVNSAESPFLFARCHDSAYYAAHLQFLRELARRYEGVTFHDLATALPAEDFNDWHHVNYVGLIKLGQRYAEMIRGALRSASPDRGAGASTREEGDARQPATPPSSGFSSNVQRPRPGPV